MVGKLLQPYILTPLICLLYCIAVVIVRGQGDSLILMTIGADYNISLADHAYTTEGYDGQFTYYIASNPQTASQYVDVPAYRFQRILLPISGYFLGLGQSQYVPYALLLINLFALAGGTYLLGKLLGEFNVSQWFVIGYSLSIGVFGAARLVTTETLAYGLVLLAIWLYHKDKWLLAAIIFAVSAFAKEVTLIFVAGYVLYMFQQHNWQHGLIFGSIAGIPFVIWQVILFNVFGEFGIGSGGNLATGFEFIPFMGFMKILTVGGFEVFLILAPIIGIFVILPTIWGLWQCWQDFQNRQWSLWTWLLFANSTILLFVPFSTYREPLGILRFIVGLQISVIIYSAKYNKKRVLMNSTIWFITTLFLVMSDFSLPV